MRLARYKVTGQDAWYHIHCRISGSRGEFPLSEALPTRKFVELLRRFSQIYFCEVAAFSVMGNHYHLVVKFQHLESISEEQLEERARLLYPSSTSRRVMEHWPPEKWARLRSRLFDVSEFMRSLQSAYARWYNHTYDRRGRFWADRFKSVVLEKGNAVLDCMLYVDLNPIRAGLVDRPEDWAGSSYYLRDIGDAKWLMPLKEIVDCRSEKQALEEYRARLYLPRICADKTGTDGYTNPGHRSRGGARFQDPRRVSQAPWFLRRRYSHWHRRVHPITARGDERDGNVSTAKESYCAARGDTFFAAGAAKHRGRFLSYGSESLSSQGIPRSSGLRVKTLSYLVCFQGFLGDKRGNHSAFGEISL